jgi:hypothetical protein
MKTILLIVALCALGAISPASAQQPSTEFVPYVSGVSQTPLLPIVSIPKLLPPRYWVPVYIGGPDRVYDIVGTVYIYRVPGVDDPREASIKSAAAAAKAHGADALLLNPLPRTGMVYGYMSALAVKWVDR